MISPTEIIGLSWERTPLKQVIKNSPAFTKEKVRELYGSIGVDIFEGKDKITILSDKDYKKSQKLIPRIIKWWSGNGKYDYEEKDSMKDLVMKYGCNEGSGTYAQIEEKFGKEGVRIADIFKIIGYFKTW
jgi:hypothetical protein